MYKKIDGKNTVFVARLEQSLLDNMLSINMTQK